MAVVETRPQFSRQEPQNSSQKKEQAPYLKKKSRFKKLVASAVIFGAFGVGAKVGADESFSHQAVIAKPITASETVQLKKDLTKKLTEKGLLGDKKKPLPIEIITFNTASGNPTIKTRQEDFLKLPFYQKVVKGEPDAPILGLQEVGPAQVKALFEATKNTDNVSFSYIRSKFSEGGNLLIIPKRFTVLENESRSYSLVQQAKGFVASLGDADFDLSQVWPRMYSEMRVQDTLSGKEFTVFNTHLSYVNDIQDEQAEELFAEVIKAKKYGPVILMGDLNDNNYLPAEIGRLTEKIRKAQLKDMGPQIPPRAKTNIDYVLASGAASLKKEYLFDVHLPGSPTAEQVSDHYAEADWIQLNR